MFQLNKLQMKKNCLLIFYNIFFWLDLKPFLCACMCIKCWTGVNFINVAALMRADPKSVKKTVKLFVIFTLLGYARIKAVHRMLMKLSPDQQKKNANKTEEGHKSFLPFLSLSFNFDTYITLFHQMFSQSC